MNEQDRDEKAGLALSRAAVEFINAVGDDPRADAPGYSECMLGQWLVAMREAKRQYELHSQEGDDGTLH